MCVPFNINSSAVSTYAYFHAYEILFSIFNGSSSLRDLCNIFYKYKIIWADFRTVIPLDIVFGCAVVVSTQISVFPF